MSENAVHALMLGAGILLTCLLISVAVFAANSGSRLNSGYTSQIDNISKSMAERDKTMFDGVTVSGSDVVNCIRKLNGEVQIPVQVISEDAVGNTTAHSPHWYLYGTAQTANKAAVPELKDDPDVVTCLISSDSPYVNEIGARDYINPNAEFLGEVMRNDNGAITTVLFRQVEYVAMADSNRDAADAPNGGTGTTVNSQYQSIMTSLGTVTNAVRDLNRIITSANLGGGGSGSGSSGLSSAELRAVVSSAVLDSIGSLNGGQLGAGTDYGDRFDEISGRLGRIESALAAWTPGDEVDGGGDSAAAQEMQEQLDELATEVAGNAGAVRTISEQLNTLDETLSALSSTLGIDSEADGDGVIPGLQSSIDDLRQSLNQVATNTDVNFAAVGSDISGIIDALTNLVGALSSNAPVDGDDAAFNPGSSPTYDSVSNGVTTTGSGGGN